MSDPIHEQISAFLDGELPGAESELLLKRLQRDPQLRRTVGRYSLIGEALRSTEAGGPSRDFADRVSLAIEQEEAAVKSWRPVANWLKPVAGGAIAAGVAAVALVSLRIAPLSMEREATNAAVSPVTMPVVAESTTRPQDREVLPSDTVPRGNANFPPPPVRVVNSVSLANFVMAHSEYSTPLGRRNVLTGLLADDAVEQNDSANEPVVIIPAQDETPADNATKARRGLATR